MIGAGIILINSNNEVLLLLRDNKPSIPYPNMWDIPGGHVESGETPEVALRREMKEEMNLDDLGEIKLFDIFISENLTDYVFWKKMDLIPSQINLKEGQKIEYFNFERIKKTRLAFGYNEILEKFFNKII